LKAIFCSDKNGLWEGCGKASFANACVARDRDYNRSIGGLADRVHDAGHLYFSSLLIFADGVDIIGPALYCQGVV
jgi:hypothetical protein